jgi:taurine--2-oxoglutarate transaminase
MTEPTPDPARGAEVLDADRAHVFHSLSAQGCPAAAAGGRAEGSYFWEL